jgi:hypothetical protein
MKQNLVGLHQLRHLLTVSLIYGMSQPKAGYPSLNTQEVNKNLAVRNSHVGKMDSESD